MQMTLLFQSALPLGGITLHKTSKCCRLRPTANINETGNEGRQDEIAAKIAKLRKLNKLPSQQAQSDEQKQQGGGESGKGQVFSDLPEWRKEEVLSNQIIEAEKFMNAGTTVSTPSSTENVDENDGDYKPKVSTWGMFPRPDNISRTYGGGRRIQLGGQDLHTEESKAKDEAIAKKLAAYRASMGIDMDREKEHEEEITLALENAQNYMNKTNPYKAIECLEQVEQFVSARSRMGGNVCLSLALAYETVGRRDEAQQLYRKLRRSPFPEISSKAKQLLQGFEAMEMLKIRDETPQLGHRVTRFRLPDFNSQIENRYETALISKEQQKVEPLDTPTSIAIFLLTAGPILFVMFVLRPAMH